MNDLWIAAAAMQYGLKLLNTDGHYRTVLYNIVENKRWESLWPDLSSCCSF
jgi:predicted nucleic acid-binding protein